MEKRLGVTGRPLEHFSDLDLLAAIEIVSSALAADGNTDAAETLAHQDAEEAALRAFYERADWPAADVLVLELGVRWPYLRARARWHEETYGAGRAALGGKRGRVVAEDRRVRLSGERDMLSRLQHRMERLEGGDQATRDRGCAVR